MSITGLDKANAVVSGFHADHFTWVPAPSIKEDPDWSTTRYHATATEIFIPHYTDPWNEGNPKILIHEFGHVVAWNSEKPIETLLAAMGADPALIQHPLINEVFAEHFARAYVDGYNGENYPQLVGLLPFDAAKMRTLCESLRPAVPASGLVAPVAITTPAGPAALFSVVDIRAELPFDAANLPWPITSEKTSTTVHWPGGDFDVQTDDDVKNLIWAFAEEHIAKDWALEVPGVQGGAGIMYAEVVAPSGTVFLTRDPDAVLWHSNDPVGNQTSRPILVICGDSHPPTVAQLRSLRARVLGLPVYPHGPHWTNTQCPGATLRAFVAGGMEDTEVFTREEFNRWFREQQVAEITPTIVAMKDVETATVEMVRKLEAGEVIDDAERAELKARLDKLHAI